MGTKIIMSERIILAIVRALIKHNIYTFSISFVPGTDITIKLNNSIDISAIQDIDNRMKRYKHKVIIDNDKNNLLLRVKSTSLAPNVSVIRPPKQQKLGDEIDYYEGDLNSPIF